MKANDVATVHTDEGYRTGLITTVGPKWVSMVWPDSTGIRINKVPNDYPVTVIEGYNLNRAKRALRRCGRNFGITKAAKEALRVGS